MQDTRITKDRIRNHFTYGLWKYALLAVAAVLGWNLIFTSTAYRAPRDKRLDVYFVTHSVPEELLSRLRGQILSMFPEMEDAACISIIYTEEDSYYGNIQLSTYIGAGEGDVFLLARERFDALKGTGAFADLTGAIESGLLDLRGIDASRGAATTEDGERGIFGIPAEPLYGFWDQGIDNRNLVICIMSYSANQETAIEFINWLIGETLAPKPEHLIEYEEKYSVGAQEISDIPSY